MNIVARISTVPRPITRSRPKSYTTVQRPPSHHITTINQRTNHHVARAFDMDMITYYTGKSIILFTMFYCTLNWWHYKQLREEYEDNEDDKKKK